jgi:hypothetical protein
VNAGTVGEIGFVLVSPTSLTLEPQYADSAVKDDRSIDWFT